MIIAFSGVDGSGKTTLAKALAEILRERGCSVRIVSPFRYFLWTPWLGFLRRRVVLPTLPETDSWSGGPPALFRLWPLLALLDHWVYFLVKLRPLAKRYDYLITDRFFFDFGASFTYFGYTFPFLDRVYTKLIPEPDLGILLDVSPELAEQRETDDRHQSEFFIKQCRYYLSLAERESLLVLDARQTTDQILGELVAILDNQVS